MHLMLSSNVITISTTLNTGACLKYPGNAPTLSKNEIKTFFSCSRLESEPSVEVILRLL